MTEVVQDGGLAVEKWFDIEELPRPARFLENAPTATEPSRTRLARILCTRQVLGRGRTKNVRHVGLDRGGIVTGPWLDVAPGAGHSSLVEKHQHFPQLHASMRLNHDGLTPIQRAAATGMTAESPDVSHDAIANQVSQLHHALASILDARIEF